MVAVEKELAEFEKRVRELVARERLECAAQLGLPL
jgi:hypothetical protein